MYNHTERSHLILAWKVYTAYVFKKDMYKVGKLMNWSTKLGRAELKLTRD